MANKIVYNNTYGGFILSEEAIKWLQNNYNLSLNEIDNLPRHDERLVKCIETLGKKASKKWSRIVIGEIEGNNYYIKEYDGLETIIEPKDIKWIEI